VLIKVFHSLRVVFCFGIAKIKECQ